MKVIAINIDSRYYPLDVWSGFWREHTPTEVLLAQDVDGNAVTAYEVVALGTKVIVDREGRIAYRRVGRAGYEELASEVAVLLN